jgi:hypothetical protein
LIPKRPMVSLALIEVSFTAKIRRKLLKPTKDVLEIRALNTFGRQDFLQDFLALLHDLEARRQIQVLGVDANTGSDFFAPSEVVANVASHVDKPDLPDNFQVRGLSTAPAHPCSVALEGAMDILGGLNKKLHGHGEFARSKLYPIGVELITDACSMEVVLSADKAIPKELVNALMEIERVSEVVTSSCTDGDEWDGSPVGSFPFVQRLCGRTFVVGTTFEDAMSDPALAAQNAVLTYRSVLRQFL